MLFRYKLLHTILGAFPFFLAWLYDHLRISVLKDLASVQDIHKQEHAANGSFLTCLFYVAYPMLKTTSLNKPPIIKKTVLKMAV